MAYNSLLTPIDDIVTETTFNGSEFFISFINKLEGYKTKCKNLHWAAPKKNIHVYLDEFLEKIQDYQDSLAEEYMGILGKMQPNVIKGVPSDALNAMDFIEEVRATTLAFYDKIPQESIYAGIKSECETFIHSVNQYKYLFGLCDIRPY